MKKQIKYRLLKDLPDAKAGAIFTFDGDDSYCYESIQYNDGISWYRRVCVENNREWFELVVEDTVEESNHKKWSDSDMTEWAAFYCLKSNGEADFKMMKYFDEFKTSKQSRKSLFATEEGWRIMSVIADDGYIINYPSKEIVDLTIEKKGERIHSVKRLSDGALFTVGDEVAYEPTQKIWWVIENFFINSKKDLMVSSKYNENVEEISTIIKNTKAASISNERVEGCGICGGEMAFIRGKHPNDDKRKICPTCSYEKLEQINDISSKEYGKTYQNN